MALVIEPARAGRGLLAQLGQQRRALDRVDRERELHVVEKADHARPCALRTQPGPHAQAVEQLRVRVAPRVGGVDAAREPPELRVDASKVVAVGIVHPGCALADRDALGGTPGGRQIDRRVARLESQPQLADQLAVCVHPIGDHLATPLHRTSVREQLLLDAATGAPARLEHDDVGAARGQVARGGQAGESGAQHHHVMHAASLAPSLTL